MSHPEEVPGRCTCSAKLPRRGLLAALLGAVGLLLLPARALAKKVAVKLDSLPGLKQVGGFVVATIKDRDILLIRETASTVRAVEAHCTHKRFLLSYDARARQIHCKNHGSRFELGGKVLKGPAAQPLTVFPAELDAAGRVLLKLD